MISWHSTGRASRYAVAGATKQFDHNCLVHALWKHFLELGTEVYVTRVPTDYNIADNPSRFAQVCGFAKPYTYANVRLCRESYHIFGLTPNAKKVRPKLEKVYLEAQTWAALSLKNWC